MKSARCVSSVIKYMQTDLRSIAKRITWCAACIPHNFFGFTLRSWYPFAYPLESCSSRYVGNVYPLRVIPFRPQSSPQEQQALCSERLPNQRPLHSPLGGRLPRYKLPWQASHLAQLRHAFSFVPHAHMGPCDGQCDCEIC